MVWGIVVPAVVVLVVEVVVLTGGFEVAGVICEAADWAATPEAFWAYEVDAKAAGEGMGT